MMTHGLGILLISLGTLFLLIGSIGVVRLPDFYTRTHAMTKPDTMGLILTMSGLALLNGWNINSLKLFLVVVFVAMANPATSHALARAAYRNGLRPWSKKKSERAS